MHKVVLPRFNKEVHGDAKVTEGDEVMTLPPEEQETDTLSFHTWKIQRKSVDLTS